MHEVAEDIVAYTDRRMEHFAFRLLPRDGDEAYVVYISGATDYVSYRFKPEVTLKRLTECFFGDAEILTRMIRALAARVIHAVEKTVDKIRELEQRVRDLESKVRSLELKDEDF